ncbi:hypothetical protein LXL04_034128 [Taraxacum kok-saghyz]
MEETVLGENAENPKFVSVREYYAYKLQIRQADKSCLLYFGRLLQQHIVDNYVKLETQRLDFFRTQQDEIRQEFLQGVVDAMANGETEGATIGKRIVLPSSFIGGPRNMRQKYVDAMALVQKFGKPDIFLTITCNPNWPEIKENLKPYEEAENRPDLAVRVFHAKLELLKHELFKNHIFRDVAAYTYVIEFQKRGFPHAHFLLILKPHFKMHTAEEYDRIVSAEIPIETANPHLFQMVKKHMFHGPCGCDKISFNVSSNKNSTFVNEIDRYQSGRFAKELNLTYVQFPDHFVWKADKKYWSPRQTGDSIGRIVIAHPNEGERYYLRILLSKVRCPKSFSDLKLFNGVKADTFREAALLRGYLLDDNTQHLCLEEASAFHMPYELRRLFATLLVYTCPNTPRQLWLCFEDAMLEDIVRHHKETRKQSKHRAFEQIDYFLQSMGRRLNEFDVLPRDFSDLNFEDETKEIKAEKSIVVSNEDLLAIETLNKRQKVAFDTIIDAVDSHKSGAFFIDGPGGTGKTFLYRAILAKFRSAGHIALATATSGIAASLLPGGRTAHSRFKIPLDAAEGLMCRISKQSSLAALIKSSKLIIWDEAPMAKKSAVEALDNLLRDLMDSSDIFGGEEVEYISFDETIDPNDQPQYEDLLHCLTPNGMPSHRLILKHNAPIILLRNMNPFKGLCNGTRLFCKDFQRNVIRAEISYGEFAGKEVFIHRIALQPPSGEQFTVPFKRFQFPIRLCFAMTINKAYGQTLDFVGVYLKEPVFSHGQLIETLTRH